MSKYDIDIKVQPLASPRSQCKGSKEGMKSSRTGGAFVPNALSFNSDNVLSDGRKRIISAFSFICSNVLLMAKPLRILVISFVSSAEAEKNTFLFITI